MNAVGHPVFVVLLPFCFQPECCVVYTVVYYSPGIRMISGDIWNYLVDSNSNFCRRGSYFQIVLRFFVCSEFIHTQSDLTCACVAACFHTCVDVSQQMQTHWKEKGEIERETTTPLHTSRRTSQTETDKQAHHTSIPNNPFARCWEKCKIVTRASYNKPVVTQRRKGFARWNLDCVWHPEAERLSTLCF